MTEWTNEAAIASWDGLSREAMDAWEPEGDHGRRHLLNPVVLRMLGDVAGRRLLDAGCGQGYLSRMLARLGAEVVGVEATSAMFGYAVDKEREAQQGVTYVQADLSRLPALGAPFDAVVCNMVLMAIPEWEAALGNCVSVLRPGGLLVFSIEHPCFEGARRSWVEKGVVEVGDYLEEAPRPGPHGVDFHRPLSSYLNAVVALGCRLREVAEPGLDPDAVASGEEGCEVYVRIPNFVIVSAERDR